MQKRHPRRPQRLKSTAGEKSYINSGSSERALLSRILDILERAHPPSRTDLPHLIYENAQKAAKYIGIPALLIAAVLPVYNLAASSIDHRNTIYIKNTYISYADDLSNQGHFDRALRVLGQLDKIELLDARAQYTSAKITAEAAYFKGKSYDEVEDAVNILLELHKDRPWLFPAFGGKDEILALQIRLVDINIKRSEFFDALSLIASIRANWVELDPVSDARLTVQEGKGYLYTFNKESAASILKTGLTKAVSCRCKGIQAEAEHALGTMAMFMGSPGDAEQHLKNALHLFEQLGDLDGQQRSYTNIAIIRAGEFDWQGALAARRQQERIAREAGDELGIANALIGLAIIERNLGNIPRALSFVLEAEAIFQRLGHSAGLASAFANEANIYVRTGDYSKALDAANRSLTYFVGERDLRGVLAVLGIVAQAAEELGNDEEMLYGLAGSIGLARLNGEQSSASSRDLDIHLAALERFRNLEPDRFSRAKKAVEPRLRELERSLRTPQLQTGLDEDQ